MQPAGPQQGGGSGRKEQEREVLHDQRRNETSTAGPNRPKLSSGAQRAAVRERDDASSAPAA